MQLLNIKAPPEARWLLAQVLLLLLEAQLTGELHSHSLSPFAGRMCVILEKAREQNISRLAALANSASPF